MYTSYYKLRKPPFNITPDPGFFYDCTSHKDGLAYLTSAFDQFQGLGIIIGAPGTGKSMLTQVFLSRLHRDKVKAVTITSTNLLVDDMFLMIASQLEIIEPGVAQDAVLENLEKYFFDQYHLGGRVVLCIDDADNLPDESLAALRRLATLQDDNNKVVLIILLGQEKLKQKIDQASFILEPLDEVEVLFYIDHRLRHAGWQGEIPISESALARIYTYSQGVPRFINILCDRLLMNACLEESNSIEDENVESIVSDIRQEPIRNWLPSSDDVEQAHAQVSSSEPAGEQAVDLIDDIQHAVHKYQVPSTIMAGTEILEQSEMLLSLGSKLHESCHIKYSDVNVSGYINQLESGIEEFKQHNSERTYLDLESSARCVYNRLVEYANSRENGSGNISGDECRSILSLGKAGSRAGVVRSVKLENMCKVIDLANQNMHCIKLGVLGYADNLEAMFKEISGYDVSIDVSKETDSSVMVWRISVSSDVMLYLIGVPINNFSSNDEYAQLMNRLTTATVMTSQKGELTADEKISLLNSLIHCGPESSQLVGPYVDQAKGKSHFFFQGDATIPNISDGDDTENLMSAVLFPREAGIEAAASI